ncbi:amino acid adenylation domain-containing protein [Pseudoalteromonas sp. CO348]|uniref:non-ribosomal peptide synthetase n=1 Tax=unclassified Pseudoalteromonas TaxID=194690 RepID=UPI001023F04F|nr:MULTISPECIES: non-ribosomal peptide synthetase [unclassified Pseudoalteromonas]MCG7540895.1 non-ribosomal peptide synthetase [Pseudoalteromonas sp. OF7H-1]RZF98864.1 amino acid adenylation domain-containing protein [Pseudoalteromonas sp. CO348]
MNAKELIVELFQRQIIVKCDASELLLTGNIEALTENDYENLKVCKEDILALLNNTKCSSLLSSKPLQLEQYEAQATSGQKDIFFLESLVGDKSYYNLPICFSLQGVVSEDALKYSITSICQKHHIFRTIYRLDGSELIQVIEMFDDDKVHFEVIDLEDEEVDMFLAQEGAFKYDLTKDWPIRCFLLKSPSRQILSLNLHHIAADGFSAKLLTKDISESYYNFKLKLKGFNDDLSNSPNQYARYAEWFQSYLSSDDAEEARNYWKSLLLDAPKCHNFPLEFNRPSSLSIDGDTASYNLIGSLKDKVLDSAKKYDISAFFLLQSLFVGFMARLGDESDLVIGVPYSNRTTGAFTKTVGMFANTIPFRYKFDGKTDISHVINSTKEQNQKALKYQHYPFEKIIECAGTERDASYNPLFQVHFVLQDDTLNQFSLADLEVVKLDSRQPVAKFDFSVHSTFHDDRIALNWEFNTELLSKARVDALFDYFAQFIEHHLDNEFDSIHEFTFNEETSLQRVNKGNFADYKSNPEIIESHGYSQPQAVAVVDGQSVLTYEELVTKANKLIAGLQERGIAAGQSIAVYMEKSLKQVVTMYAVMRAGYVYIPLDPSYPEDRLDYIRADSGANLLLYSEDLVPPNSLIKQGNDATFESLTEHNRSAQLHRIQESEIAYVIYTSGSTGKPKGVMVPHGSIYYSLQANRNVYNFCVDDMMPTVGSQAFGVSLLETFVPLISGGTVKILKKSDVTNLTKLISSTQDVTVMHMVPSLMMPWLEMIESEPSLYPNLRLLLVGAEAVPPILLTKLSTWRSKVIVRVLYGMTESSVVSSGYLSHEHDGGGYCIGKPHPNMKFYTMNSYGVPQPLGVSGELYVGGLSLANGYIGKPELTEQKFVYNNAIGERLYKTGDRARLTRSGNFEFLGRVDHQVSLRGIRIETGEIESIVNQLEVVKKCLAHVVPLESGDSKFALYYTTYTNGSNTAIEDEIRTALAKEIPESMRPTVYMHLTEFPHNPNGKLDRTKLPKPVSSAGAIEPSTETEIYLSNLWSEVLELDHISVTDNFFELGGHSLMATKLVNLINKHFHISLPLKSFFESSTIQGCASIIDQELLQVKRSQAVLGGISNELEEETDEFII